MDDIEVKRELGSYGIPDELWELAHRRGLNLLSILEAVRKYGPVVKDILAIILNGNQPPPPLDH